MTDKFSEEGRSFVGLIAAFGLVVAGLTFFVAFITNQKAATPHPQNNLRIPPIDANNYRPTFPPLREGQQPVFVVAPSPTSSPTTETATDSAPLTEDTELEALNQIPIEN